MVCLVCMVCIVCIVCMVCIVCIVCIVCMVCIVCIVCIVVHTPSLTLPLTLTHSLPFIAFIPSHPISHTIPHALPSLILSLIPSHLSYYPLYYPTPSLTPPCTPCFSSRDTTYTVQKKLGHVCDPECGRLYYNAKEYQFISSASRPPPYPYMSLAVWPDSRFKALSMRDAAICDMIHASFYPWTPPTAGDLHKQWKASASAGDLHKQWKASASASAHAHLNYSMPLRLQRYIHIVGPFTFTST